MSEEPRSRRRRLKDPEPCGEFHNHGHWPYVAACVHIGNHPGKPHLDKHGNTWIISQRHQHASKDER